REQRAGRQRGKLAGLAALRHPRRGGRGRGRSRRLRSAGAAVHGSQTTRVALRPRVVRQSSLPGSLRPAGARDGRHGGTMIKRNLAGCLLGLSAAMAGASDAPSPARAQMDGFIAAFNSGDRATSGGFEVLDVTETSPLALTGHVRERKTRNVV